MKNIVLVVTLRTILISTSETSTSAMGVIHTIQKKKLLQRRRRWENSWYWRINKPRVGVGPRIYIVCKGVVENSFHELFSSMNSWHWTMRQQGCMLLLLLWVDHSCRQSLTVIHLLAK